MTFDKGFSNATCPAKTITTEVASPVPAPWKSTKYIWNLTGASSADVGGQSVILCTYFAPWDSQHVGPSSLLQPLNLGDEKPLATTPKPDPERPGNLTAAFAVTNAKLAVVPAPRQRACPTKVAFQGSIEVNGPGEVIYRIVDNKGVAGAQQKLTFSRAGVKPLAFQIDVDAPMPPTSAHRDSFATAPTPGSQVAGGGAAAGANVTGASAPGTIWGFSRIEILAPAGGASQSQDAAWSVQCVTVNQQPGPTGLQAPPRKLPPAMSAPKPLPPPKPRDATSQKDAGRK